MTRLATILGFAMAGAATLQGVGAQGRGIPGGVAFYSMRDGNAEIYTMDADGQNQTRITFHANSDVDPAISPDGRDIIFTSNRGGNNDIFIVDARGGTPVNLTNHSANDGWARWSPDGHYIVFHSNRDQNDFEIYVMDRDGGSVARLTERPGSISTRLVAQRQVGRLPERHGSLRSGSPERRDRQPHVGGWAESDGRVVAQWTRARVHERA